MPLSHERIIMLTLEERQQVLVFLRSFCILKFLPAAVDVPTWGFRLNSTSLWTSWLSIALFNVHVLYKNASLVYVLLYVPETPLHQLMIHTSLGTVAAGFVYCYYVLYIKNADVYARFVQMTLTGQIAESMCLTSFH